MTRLILIRHGESQANRHHLFAGSYDAPLEENGMRQARITAKFIAENYKVEKIYSSDLRRAYSTAKALADELGLDVEKAPKIREIGAGDWEGMKFSDIIEKYPNEYKAWTEHIDAARCPNGESIRELGQRVMAELLRIAEENEGKTVAIATHATPIRTSQTFITYGSFDKMQSIPWVSNASVTVYNYENGKWSIEAVSLDAHLEGCKTALPPNV
jgi:probable phosphoglycerate mutase